MQRILAVFTLVVSVLLPISATAQEETTSWKEGEHYEIINGQSNPRLGVVEVFSYWCPHCYNFEIIVSKLKSRLPSDTQFTKAHVDFMSSAHRVVQQEATKTMLIARAINREDAFNQALFKAIHIDKKHFANANAIRQVLLEQGVDGEKFNKLSESFGMQSRINRNYKLSKGIKEVPTFIVNGKYQPKFTRDMTPEKFIELILWLNNQP